MKESTKISAMLDLAENELPVAVDDFVLEVDMDVSGSGIDYLGHNTFGIYDYPPAEEWLRNECSWEHDLHRLGDGTFHCVIFKDPQGSVEFKLRWGRAVVKYAR